MAATYRVGVIGHTGRGNYGHGLDVVWRNMPDCEIVGVADANENGLKQATKRLETSNGYLDYRALLEEQKPDIVAICPRWIDSHLEICLAAAERGIHMYLEKPMCRTLQEADQIVAACENENVKFAIAHQTRYSPKLQTLRDLIHDGAIGQILELRSRGKEDHRGGGEDLWVLGSHLMNLMHHFGGEPLWCFATVLQGNEPVIEQTVQEGNEGIGPLAGDALYATYGMQNGVSAYFGSRRNMSARGNRFGLQILGSEGIVEILTGYLPEVHILQDPLWSPARSGKNWQPVSSAGIGKPEPYEDNSRLAGNVAVCRDLIDAIEGDRLPECNVYEGRTTIEMIAAVFDSHRTGGPVSIPLENRRNPLTMLT